MMNQKITVFLVIILLITDQMKTLDGKFLFHHKKGELLGKLYKKITTQPNYCFSFCSK